MANLSVEYADMLLPGTVFISLAGVLGIFGNIIVIALYWCKIQDENGDRYFIPVLAVVDLLGSMSMTAYNVMDNYFFFNYPSETCCRWLTFSVMINGFLSPALLLIIAVQRHKKVCRSGDFSLFWRRVSIAIAIVVSVLIMVPTLIFSGTSTLKLTFQGRNVTGTLCKVVDKDNVHKYHHLIFIHLGSIYSFLLAILITLVVLYALIALRLKRVFKSIGTENEPLVNEPNSNPDATETAPNRGVQTWFNLMYALIVIAFILAFVPTAVTLMLAYTDVNYLDLPKPALVVWIIFGRFMIVNHFVNPIIYTCFDVKFRTALSQMCNCRTNKSQEMLSVPS